MSPKTVEKVQNRQSAGIVTNFREGKRALAPGNDKKKALNSHAAAETALAELSAALNEAAGLPQELDRMREKLNRAASAVRLQLENRQAVASRMTDVNVILEMSEFVRRQILTQPSLAGLSGPDNLAVHLLR